jgi:thymidylate kinase/energy-coupling factor transporter ATP-binding protein EcfA2
MTHSGRHVIVEGLPAVGKSETLALLARFYPRSIRVLPELVKSIVEEEHIDLFRERARLTQALTLAVPRRRADVEAALRAGFLCLEESHLGVHYAYAAALADTGFLEAYPDLERQAPRPDLYVRLDIPVSESVARQTARGTPEYDVREELLARVSMELSRWHTDRGSQVLVLDADRPPGEMVRELEQALGLTYFGRQTRSAFDVLLLLGRPASGKSEFIDFMNRVSAAERGSLFHIGPFSVVDDFPILWQKFEEDDAWERLGFPRLYSKRADGNYAVSDDRVWRFLIDRLNSAAGALPRVPGRSLLVEFSRGGSAGYRDALAGLSDEILSRAAILYLSVSFAESWRRNVARYDEKRRSGILTHSVPREEMERTYGTDDWPSLTQGRPDGFLALRGHRIPFATLPNEPEAVDPEVLRTRYHGALEALFQLWSERRP